MSAAAGGEEPASPRRRRPSTQGKSGSLASLRRPTLSALVTALGAGLRFPQRRSGRVVPGGDDYTTGRRRARHLRVVNDFAERGVALISAFFCGAITLDEEQRQALLQVVEAPRAFVPVREIGIGWPQRWDFVCFDLVTM
ncbi:hypothetical protein GWK47_006281 [Chionoecetes opilio]|uniref:Uncharacterized protein n=1 Tax=Chionoecetes opilio TaxID=41210 RepID=A0A8J4Y6N8_CHIOP|nr:hypothetical protein GWK47_006281 [Chionoecetes opilio]